MRFKKEISGWWVALFWLWKFGLAQIWDCFLKNMDNKSIENQRKVASSNYPPRSSNSGHLFLQNNFLLMADYNFCWTDADKKARLWNEGEFSSLFRVFFFIKHFLQAVEIRQDCCPLLFLLLFCFLSSLFSSFFFQLFLIPWKYRGSEDAGKGKQRKGREEAVFPVWTAAVWHHVFFFCFLLFLSFLSCESTASALFCPDL